MMTKWNVLETHKEYNWPRALRSGMIQPSGLPKCEDRKLGSTYRPCSALVMSIRGISVADGRCIHR
jgi:hypothetical protein